MLAGNELSHECLEVLLSHRILSIQASTTLINSPFLTFAIISLIHAHPRKVTVALNGHRDSMRPGATRNIRDDLIRLVESHGYRIQNPDALSDRDTTINPREQSYPQAPDAHVLNQFIALAAAAEDVLTMPHMYDQLVSFVDQVP
jgi:hypothetical protein